MSEDTTTPPSRSNPYVGPRSYKRGETLYGREQESTELLDLLIAERIVMLYSPSGAGKSSILNAVVLPKMEENGFDVLPVMRVNLEPAENLGKNPAFNRYIYSLLVSMEESVPEENRFAPTDLAGMRLKEYLENYQKRASEINANYDGSRCLLLVVDQGEEVITIDPTNRQDKQEFFNQLGEALRNREIWLLYSLREDYLARFDSYIRPVPTGFASRYRLRLLSAASAISCVSGPAKEQGVDFVGEAAQKLVDDLRGMRVQQADGTSEEQLGYYVEPVQLQVVCRRLWGAIDATANQITIQDLEKIGSVDSALADYYALQIASVAAKTGVREREIREWFDRKLITKQGIRSQVLLAPGKSDDLENEAIAELEKTYLVRSEKRGGSTWFELAHDRLITPVQRNNADWFDKNLSLLQRAADVWEQQGRSDGLLLFGKDFLDAQTWATENVDILTLPEQDFLAACLKYHVAQQNEERTHRVVRTLLGVSLFMLVAALFMFNRALAAENRAMARELAAKAVGQIDDDPEDSIRIALASELKVKPISPENIQALHQALPAMRTEHILKDPESNQKIYSGAFSPDGRIAVSGGLDGNLKVWDAEAGVLLQRIPLFEPGQSGADIRINNVAFSPDNRMVAVAMENRLALVDAQTWKVARIIQTNSEDAWGVDFSADSKLVAASVNLSSGKSYPGVWDVATGKALACVNDGCDSAKDEVLAVVFSPDGTHLISSGVDTRLITWKISNDTYSLEEIVPSGHSRDVETLNFSSDGRRLVSVSDDRLLKVWDMTEGTPKFLMDIPGHRDWVYSAEFTPDGKYIVSSSSDRTVRVWDAQYGRLVLNLQGHQNQVYSVSVNFDGTKILSASEDGTLRIWNMLLTSEVASNSFGNSVNAIAYSSDGKQLAGAGRGTQIKVWSGETGELLKTLDGSTGGVVEGLAWTNDGKRLVSADRGGNVLVWNVADGTLEKKLAQYATRLNALALLDTDSEKLVAVGGEKGIVYILNLETGQEVKQLAALPGSNAILSLAFSPAKKQQVVIGYVRDGNNLGQSLVHTWSLDTGKVEGLENGHTDSVQDIAFSPNGERMASVGDDGLLIVWDATVQPFRVISEIEAHQAAAYALTFATANFQGKEIPVIVTGSVDSTINVWNVTDYNNITNIYSLYGSQDRVQSLSNNLSNHQLASGGNDGIVRIFTLDDQELVKYAKSRLQSEYGQTADAWKYTDSNTDACKKFFNTTCGGFYSPSPLDWLKHLVLGTD